jgi:hypothetical protein
MSNVVSLKEALEASIVHIDERKRMAERAAAIREMQITQGKENIANGLRILQVIAGPEFAIKHMRNTLAAIDPTFEPREF